MTFKWIKLHEVYTTPTFNIKLKTKFCINLELDSLFDEFDRNHLKSILSQWTYGYENKTIKPFKLLDFKMETHSFRATFLIKHRNELVNEIDILCEDLVQINNLSKSTVKKITIGEI